MKERTLIVRVSKLPMGCLVEIEMIGDSSSVDILNKSKDNLRFWKSGCT
jgi:hypothetical protein